jgi:hypothetical protein
MTVERVTEADIGKLRTCGVNADKKDKSWRCKSDLKAPQKDDIARMVRSYVVIASKRRGVVDAWLTYTPSGRIGWLVYDPARFDTAVPPLLETVARECGKAFGYIESDDARARMRDAGYDVDDKTTLVTVELSD